MTNPSMYGAIDLSSLAAKGRTAPAAPVASPAAEGAAAPQTSAVDAPAGGEAQPPRTVQLPGLIFDATEENFATISQLSATVPVVIDLWAEWCGPCKQLTPVLERLIAEFDGRLVLAKVDVDANPRLSQAFQAQSIPTVAALVAGRPVGLFVGAQPEQQVREILQELLTLAAEAGVSGQAVVADGPAADAPEPEPEPLPPLHQEAFDAIERGDYEAAVKAYRQALAESPADAEAKAGLAQVSLLARLAGKTLSEVRGRAAAAPEDLDAQLDVADLDLSGGHIEDAFDRLLTVFPGLVGDERDSVRERLLDYFEVVGAEDERVIAARRRLTALLF